MAQEAVEVRCFPRADGSFEQAVREALGSMEASADDLVRRVEAVLHARYPNARVVPQDRLAELRFTAIHTLYVYRDGSL